MIFTQNLSIKEQIYILELAHIVNQTITLETLNSLKPGVLQHALTSLPNLDSRKIKILNKILDKINYYGFIKEGELAPAKFFLESKIEETKI